MTSCSPSSVALNSAFSQLLSLTAELMNIHRRVHRAVAVSCTTRDHRYTTLADTRRVSALLTYVWLISSKHFPHLTVTEISFLQQWRSMLGRGGGTAPHQIVTRPPNLAVLLTHCGQLVNWSIDSQKKIVHLMSPDVRF